MTQRLKRSSVNHWTSCLLGLLVWWCASSAAFAVQGQSPAPASLRTELLLEAVSGRVVHSVDLHAARHPASLTKLMTAYLTFEALAGGLVQPDDELTVSAHVAAQPTTRLGLTRGQRIRLEDALRATLVSSANDAAVALAEHLGSSEAAFAQLMTGTAERLGMHNTVFRNATGLPHDEQVTTAYDMGRLARAVVEEYPDLYARYSTAEYRYKGRVRTSTNALMRDYPGADGIKTGYTCGSGFNLIASAVRDGRRLIGVILGARTKDERNGRMRELLDLGFKTEPGSLDAALSLDELTAPRAGRPPIVLTGKACGSGAGCSAVPLTSAKGLSGWAVLLGNFRGKPYAEQALAKACKSTSEDLRGKPALIERSRPEFSLWTALMVGYSQADAKAVCKGLDQSAQPCRVLAPQGISKALGKPPKDLANSPTPSKKKKTTGKTKSKTKPKSKSKPTSTQSD